MREARQVLRELSKLTLYGISLSSAWARLRRTEAGRSRKEATQALVRAGELGWGAERRQSWSTVACGQEVPRLPPRRWPSLPVDVGKTVVGGADGAEGSVTVRARIPGEHWREDSINLPSAASRLDEKRLMPSGLAMRSGSVQGLPSRVQTEPGVEAVFLEAEEWEWDKGGFAYFV